MKKPPTYTDNTIAIIALPIGLHEMGRIGSAFAKQFPGCVMRPIGTGNEWLAIEAKPESKEGE